MSITTPATALWNQRQFLASKRDRLLQLIHAVGKETDLTPLQWAQLGAYVLEFKPDLIIELGRGYGNSTALFLEMIEWLGGPMHSRLLSICRSDEWFLETAPKLKQIVSPEWFAGGDFLQTDICSFDFASALQGSKRCLLFWDAHGFEIAETVLATMMPALAEREHRVLMHDMSDSRYEVCDTTYGNERLWANSNAEPPAFFVGHVQSRVAQAISALDFTARNKIPLHSAVESLADEINTPKKLELEQLLGTEFICNYPQAHWFWFTLNEAPGPVTYPAAPSVPKPKGSFVSKLWAR